MSVIDCPERFRSSFHNDERKGVMCTRGAGHLGKHQVWNDAFRATWDQHGSSSSYNGEHWSGEVYTCSICGALEEWHWAESVIRHSLDYCFDCNFWVNIIKSDMPNRAIVNGRHYEPQVGWDGKMGGKGGGFGGSRYQIHYFNGREIVSRNVWTQGEIPTQFRDRLPDNAEFIRTPR